jgi:ADP-ribose pyrophosphatase
MDKIPRKHGPWTIEERNLKYQNPWVKVYEDKVVRPDGKKGTHVFIDVVKGVSVLPIDDERNIYLTKEFHYGVGEVTLEVVAGAVNEKESYLEAIKRELREELGIIAEKFIDLGPVTQITTLTNYYNHAFLAQKLTFTQRKLEGTETIELVKIKLEEAVQMIIENKITHSHSCMLILKAYQMLKKKK